MTAKRPSSSNSVGGKLTRVAKALSSQLDALTFEAPVAYVYNPLAYAFPMHAAYLERFARQSPQVLFVGMNPGPFGMMQTGIPFGEVRAVRDWMKLDAPIGKPKKEHPKRPVLGLATTRNEVSGARLWGWAAERFGSAENFFAQALVVNYCPLGFLEASGANRTPDKLPKPERAALEALCDEALASTLKVVAPVHAIGVGTFAEACIRRALPANASTRVGRIAHPSPASPQANRGWAPLIERELAEQGVVFR